MLTLFSVSDFTKGSHLFSPLKCTKGKHLKNILILCLPSTSSMNFTGQTADKLGEEGLFGKTSLRFISLIGEYFVSVKK